MSKKRRSLIHEIRRTERGKVKNKEMLPYSESFKTWESELFSLKKLIDEYPKGRKRWKPDFEEFVDVWHAAILSKIRGMDNQLDLGSDELNAILSFFSECEQHLQVFLESKNYSLSERRTLKTFYVFNHAVGLYEFVLQEQKSLKSQKLAFKRENLVERNSEHQISLFIWWLSYHIFKRDLLIESQQVDSFSELIFDLFL